MITKIYTVYDSKLDAYMTPFFMQSKGAAIRAFSDTVNEPNSPFYKHPADFTLFEIGEYDDATAKITSAQALQSLGTALEFKNSDAKQNMIKGVMNAV